MIQAANWQIFDKDGKSLGSGPAGPGQVWVDAEAGLMYFIDRNGFLGANQLADGKRKFLLSNWGGELSAFSLVEKRGPELLLAAFELPKTSDLGVGDGPPPATSVLELVRFIQPLNVDGDLLINASSRSLHVEAAPLYAARNGDTIVAAVAEALLFITNDLNKVRAAYDLSGRPLALSLDEASYAYLIIETVGRRRLCKVGPKGSVEFSVALPPSTNPFPKPPVIGYDHRVFVIVDSQLLAFGSDGVGLWTRPLSAKPGGMTITPAGTLVVSDGAELAIFQRDGQRKRLFDFANEQLTTPPTITERGEIEVASQTHLYLLRPH